MQTKSVLSLARTCLLLSLANQLFPSLLAQGTAFTFQGRLTSNGAPFSGSAEFQPTLWDAISNGSQIATSSPPSVVVNVTNGLFVLPLDFGDHFPGADRWLQLDVRTAPGPFTTLAPRQQITPAPYAITANSLSGLTVQQNTNGAPNVVGGATVNFASSNVIGATIAGGGVTDWQGKSYTNSVTGNFGTIGGGYDNLASRDWTTVGGGSANLASGFNATVSGGYQNTASGNNATVAGGADNTASGDAATVAGGSFNTAGGAASFAAGSQAQALHAGSFVWSDDSVGSFASTSAEQFLIRAAGGVGINTNAPTGALTVNTGVGTLTMRNDGPVPALVAGNSSTFYSGYLRLRNHLEVWPNDAGTADGYVDIRGTNGAPNITLDGQSGKITCITLNQTSDRNVKADCAPVNPETMLAKVATLPITEWVYKTDAGARHIGPMAQDFHAAFGLNGNDDKHITTVDEGGVALAAIQGLNQKVAEQLKQKESEIQQLQHRLEKLEQLLNQKTGEAQ